MSEAPPPPESTMTARARSKSRSPYLLALALAGGCVALALIFATTWIGSEAALNTVLDYVAEKSGGKLTFDKPRGTLLGRIEVERIVYRDAEATVTIDNVSLDHAPRSLLDRRLTIRDLVAKRVHVDVHSTSEEPVTLPESLELPFDLTVERATVERLEWKYGDDEGLLENVGVAYQGDRHLHSFKDLDVSGQGGRLTGEASIASRRPFATRASLTLDLNEPQPRGRVQAELDGDFDKLTVVAKSTVAGIVADLEAKVAPFAAQPLLEGKVNARDVDLAQLRKDLPATRLTIVADAKPAPGGFSGHARIANALAGPLDANRIPIAQLSAAFTLAGVKLELRNLDARAGGGTVSGSGSVNIDTLENRWKVVVAALDLKRIHTALIETRLAGKIEADVDDKVQRVIADVSQTDVRLAFDARYDGRTVTADRLLAQARDGSLEGSGSITLAGERPFSADVRAKQFDPSRFGDFPPGSINATIVAKGTALPAIVAEADVSIAPGSRFAGLATQGRVTGRFARANAQALVADVSLGANRVQANGAVGRAGDRLNVAIDAKRLAELDALLPADVPKPIAGALQAQGTVDTLARGARLQIDARATQLSLGAQWRFATLALEGRATHAAPLAQLRIDAIQDLALEAQATRAITPQGRVESVRITLAGNAAAHKLGIVASDGQAAIDGSLSAAFSGGTSAPSWRGSVETLAVRGLPGVKQVFLVAPARFDIAPERVVLDAFRIDGDGANLEVDAFRWVGNALDTRGRFRNLPLAPLIKQAGLAQRFPTDMTVGGAWNVSSAPAWRGTLQVARERGDVYIDDPSLETASKTSLGIDALTLDASLDGTRVTGKGELRARLGGTAFAEFDVRAPSGASHPFNEQSALRATVRAQLPSLAALQPWIGTSARLQGQADANLVLVGTVGKPELSGQIAGSALRIDVPRYGVNFKDGQLRIASGPQGLKLEELSFAAGDGRFFASGVLGLPGTQGELAATTRINWRAENFRALNRPDLRLVVDGEGTLALERKRLVLRGKLTANEGNIEYRSSDDTTLASDIVVVNRPQLSRTRADASALSDAPLDLDLELALGRDLRFSGEGLEARLAGRVQVTSTAGGPIVGKGVIRTVRGTYYAFGQRLDIERGRIIFDGPLANPALDIVALRSNLPVEAGVEIIGTVRAPVVRLTSNPPVPDNEKLAWLLTGGPSGSSSAREAAAIAAAASALSGRGGKPLTQRIAQQIGLDDISVAQRDTGSRDALSGQVVTLGKRLTDKLYVAYEQGVSVASNALRIEYVLSRYLSIAAFAGTDSGIALNYRRNWN